MKEDKKSGSAGAMMKRDASVDTLDYRKQRKDKSFHNSQNQLIQEVNDF